LGPGKSEQPRSHSTRPARSSTSATRFRARPGRTGTRDRAAATRNG